MHLVTGKAIEEMEGKGRYVIPGPSTAAYSSCNKAPGSGGPQMRVQC